MKRVAINGFGRIGRNVLRIFSEKKLENIEVVAINDLAAVNDLAHLFKYDSLYGKYQGDIETKEDYLIIDGHEIRVCAERNPENLPWKEMNVDIVIESTGIFRNREGAQKHINAGAKKVIISAPAEDEDITIVMGVNEKDYVPSKHDIISNASCTTNCLAPFTKVILEEFGIENGLITTVHSYTNDQRILDSVHKDKRRSRAAAESIIPTTTGAAKAVALVLPELKGKLDGMAMRVPTPTVSVVDAVFNIKKETTKEEINALLKKASESELKDILGYSDEPLVSMDYRKDDRSSIIDALSTIVIGKTVKVVSWYDNEWGYSTRVVDLTKFISEKSS